MRRRTFGLLLALTAASCGGSGDTKADGSVPLADAGPGEPDASNPGQADAAPVACPSPPVSGTPDLDLEVVVDGLVAPVAAVVPPGESRIFVVEKQGFVDIVENGQVKKPRFLDISNLVLEGYNERGLLGIAFHPGYATNKRFYVYYTAVPNGTVTIAQYTASSADNGNAGSGKVLLTIPHQQFPNHNGGWMAFGPDGKLYITVGDGGSGGDPNRHGQDNSQLLGKMLRLDVDTADTYKTPSDNPFNGTNGKQEIWAYGLRNAWRNSFDRDTGDLYIADVGQDAVEEIDVRKAHSPGGANFGWSCREGGDEYNADQCDQLASMVKPIYTYNHDANRLGDTHASVTGGYVYRGCKMPDLRGTYFFGDAVHARLWSLKWNGTDGIVPNSFKEYTNIQKTPYSFGEDQNGELLLCDGGGAVFRIIPKP